MGPMSVAFISSHLSNSFSSTDGVGGGLYFCVTGSTVLSMFNLTYFMFPDLSHNVPVPLIWVEYFTKMFFKFCGKFLAFSYVSSS